MSGVMACVYKKKMTYLLIDICMLIHRRSGRNKMVDSVISWKELGLVGLGVMRRSHFLL